MLLTGKMGRRVRGMRGDDPEVSALCSDLKATFLWKQYGGRPRNWEKFLPLTRGTNMSCPWSLADVERNCWARLAEGV